MIWVEFKFLNTVLCILASLPMYTTWAGVQVWLLHDLELLFHISVQREVFSSEAACFVQGLFSTTIWVFL